MIKKCEHCCFTKKFKNRIFRKNKYEHGLTVEMLNYNSRLQSMHQKGVCGDQEFFELPDQLTMKVRQLAKLIREAKKCVIFTGAGISTSSGIPDFRGPNGVWTKELKGISINEEEKTTELFNRAVPSFSHHAIVALVQMNLVHHVISQNVDGLHLRSGLSPTHLSELHGNICIEECETCGLQYFRDQDVGGMGLRHTGNICSDYLCQGKLRDFAVDWDTELPTDIFRHARKMIQEADLCICVGTSLRIRPAGNMPLSVTTTNKSRGYKGQLAIINLQRTHLDGKCRVRIFHECDEVFRKICEELAVFVNTEQPLVNTAVLPPRSSLYAKPKPNNQRSQNEGADGDGADNDVHLNKPAKKRKRENNDFHTAKFSLETSDNSVTVHVESAQSRNVDGEVCLHVRKIEANCGQVLFDDDNEENSNA